LITRRPLADVEQTVGGALRMAGGGDPESGRVIAGHHQCASSFSASQVLISDW
jgi:hypothetical protein